MTKDLTSRQREILRLKADGLSNREIGAELGISTRAVEAYTGDALARLGARNVTHAVAIALRKGVIL